MILCLCVSYEQNAINRACLCIRACLTIQCIVYRSDLGKWAIMGRFLSKSFGSQYINACVSVQMGFLEEEARRGQTNSNFNTNRVVDTIAKLYHKKNLIFTDIRNVTF